MAHVRLALGVVLSLTALLLACGGDNGEPLDRTATPGTGPTPTSPGGTTTATGVALQAVATGLDQPTFVAGAEDGSGRLFVLEKAGRVRVISRDQLQTVPFLDITDRVDSSAAERGLLGFAAHPSFAENGRFFVVYTAAGGAVTLAEYSTVSPGAAVADPGGERVLLSIDHPRGNHNGGMVAFGPDGFLYMSTGDGGGSGDPDRAAQDRLSLAGKILRLDVDAGTTAPYGLPPDNPFLPLSSARGEIWASGLRNPWRFSFDRASGDLWIADVGESAVEEVNFQPADSPGGENYGWSVVEGDRCFRPSQGCDTADFVAPVHVYDHGRGCSVTGGYVYRGSALPELEGAYLFSDYCAKRLQALRLAGGAATVDELGVVPGSVSSFGEDDAGELYVVSDELGTVFRVVPAR